MVETSTEEYVVSQTTVKPYGSDDSDAGNYDDHKDDNGKASKVLEGERQEKEETEASKEGDEKVEVIEVKKNGRDAQLAVLQKNLREEVKQINDLSYLVDDEDTLREVVTTMENVEKNLSNHCCAEKGLVVRLSPSKKKLKSRDFHKVFYKKLQRRKNIAQS